MSTHIYARASTKLQESSPPEQLKAMRAYADAMSFRGPILEYADRATTSKIPLREREHGGAMMAALKPGDHVIICKLDRAFRNLKDCVITIDDLCRVGVSLHVLNFAGGTIDITDRIGKLILQILAVVAEFERSMIVERTTEGQRRIRRMGIGGGNAPRGFKYQRGWQPKASAGMRKHAYCKIVPDPEQRKIMGMIVALRDSGMSWDVLRQHINYTLRIPSPRGGEWGNETLKRHYASELKLRAQEAAEREGD